MPRNVSLLDNTHLGIGRFAVNRVYDDLFAERWVFYYYPERRALTLDIYQRLHRPSKRHGWTVEAHYSRIHGHHDRQHNMDNPPLPDDVKADALKAFVEGVKVCMWGEVHS